MKKQRNIGEMFICTVVLLGIMALVIAVLNFLAESQRPMRDVPRAAVAYHARQVLAELR